MASPLFTIIIPVYNGQDVVGRALDSIYTQGLSKDNFEVICVDDCSTTMDTYQVLLNYTYNGIHPSNLKVLRHEVNKRQGAARNTALAYATGEWILYCDADDYFVENSLLKLQRKLEKFFDLDCVMFDCVEVVPPPYNIIKHSMYTSLNLRAEIVLSGREFIQKYPVPWGPVFYAYKKDFLQKYKIEFLEDVLFEDTDYVIKCTLYANKMTFLSLEVMTRMVNYGSTTTIGNNQTKITDLYKLSIRMKNLAEEFIESDREASMAAMSHHVFHFHDMIVKYLWRLRYSTIVRLLEDYPPFEDSDDRLMNFVIKYPRTYAAIAQLVRPILLAAIWMRNKLRKF